MADEEEPEDDPEPEIPEDADDANDAATPAETQSPTVSKSLPAGSGVEKSEKSRSSTRSGVTSDRAVTPSSTIGKEGIIEPLEEMWTKSQEQLSNIEEISLDVKKSSLNELSKDRLRNSKKMYRQCHRRFREIIGKRELKNEELEKQTGDLKQRLNILECSMPAVMVWNIWRMTQGASVPSLKRILEKQFQGPASGEVYCPSTPSRHFDCRVREVEAERKQALKRAEEARSLWAEKVAALEDRDKRLEEAKKIQEETKEKIQQLTAEAQKLKAAASKDAEDGACETGECGVIECKKKWLDKVPSNTSIRTTDIECLQRLQDLAEKELAMKRQMADMERREEAYMRTLQQADELWSKLEGDAASTVSVLQEQLGLKTTANQKMANRICELEDVIEQLMARLSKCRGELEKYVSATKIEALIGRDDDFADILDKGVSAFAEQEEMMVGTDGYVGGVHHRGVLAKSDMAEKHVMAGAEMSDAQLEIHPGDFDYEARKLKEAGDERLIEGADYLGKLGSADDLDYEALEERKEDALRKLEESGDERLIEAAEYLAQIGSLSELDKYGDDFVCDITCNDQVLTESGLTEEEIKALEENRISARALMEKTGMNVDEELAKVRAILEPAETVVKTEIFEEDVVERAGDHVAVTMRTVKKEVEYEKETLGPTEVEAAEEIGVAEGVFAEPVAIPEEYTVPAEGAEEVAPMQEVVTTEEIAVLTETAQEIAPGIVPTPVEEAAEEVPPAIVVAPVEELSIPEEAAKEVATHVEELSIPEEAAEEVAVSKEAAEEVPAGVIVIPVEEVAVPEEPAGEMAPAIVATPVEGTAEEVAPAITASLVEEIPVPKGLAEEMEPPTEATTVDETAVPKGPAEEAVPTIVATPVEGVAAPEKVLPDKEVVVGEEVAPATEIAEEVITAVAEGPEVPTGAVVTEITDVATEAGAVVADERNILVPRDQMFSWKDDVDLIRSTIAQCSNCVIVKEDADELARQLAIFTGVEAKGIDEKSKPTGEAPAEAGEPAHVDVAEIPTEAAETVPAEELVAEDVKEADELTVTEIETTEAAPTEEEIELQVQQIEETDKEAIDIEDQEKEVEVEEKEEAEAEVEEPGAAEEATGESLLAPEEQAIDEKSVEEEGEILTVEAVLDEEVVPIDVELIPEEIEPEKVEDKPIDREEASEPSLMRESEESSLEEEPCICEPSGPPQKEPLKKLEITQTEITQTEITRIETIQVITQTAEDIGTQTPPAPTVLRQIQSPKIITTTKTLHADSQMLNKIMHARRLPEQVTATSITGSSQTLMTSSFQMRTMEAPLPSTRRPDGGPKPGPEQEIRSIYYGKKAGEAKEGICDCCQCGKTVPNTAQATTAKVESRESAALFKFISTLPSLKKPHGLSMDQAAQYDAVCSHCKIKKLEETLKSHEASRKPAKKSTRDQEICACEPSLGKSQTSQRMKQRSDQSCMAKIPKATKSERVPKKSLDKDTNQQADGCPCTADIETGIPGLVKKVRCACAEFD